MSSTPELVNRLSVLSVGRVPVWMEITTGNTGSGDPVGEGAPTTAGAGVSMGLADTGDSNGAVETDVVVQLREEIHRRTARFYCPTGFNPGDDYVISVGGTPITVVGLASWTLTVIALCAALTGDANTGPRGYYTPWSPDGVAPWTAVLFKAKREASYALVFTTSGAAGIMAVADPDSGKCRVYTSPRGNAYDTATSAPGVYPSTPVASAQTASGWALEPAYTDTTLTYRGKRFRVDSAGVQRVYVELYDLAGAVGDGAAGLGAIRYIDVPSISGGHTGARVFVGVCGQE